MADEASIDPELEAKIITAIKDRDEKAFAPLLAAGFPLEAPLQSAEGKTALMLAEEYRASEISRALLHAGADWRKADMSLIHPVYDLDVIGTRRLIAEGADINVAGRIMGTPLQVITNRDYEGLDRESQFEIIRMLLEAGADVNVGVLGSAVEKNLTELVLLFFKYGATLPKDEDKPLLAIAVHKQNREIVKALIAAGADLNQRASIKQTDAQGEYKANYANATVLSIAVQRGDEEIVKMLIDAGADLYLRDEDGITPIKWAQLHGREKISAILEIAMAKNPPKANPSADLIFAAEEGDVEAVRSALRAGADPNMRDTRTRTNGFTPLMIAALEGRAAVAKELLDAGADIAAIDNAEKHNDGGFNFIYSEMGDEGVIEAGYSMHRPALSWAAQNGHHEVVKLLLERGADANVLDRVKSTALLLAAESGAVECLRLLLAAGADMSARDRSKQSALGLAARKGHVHSVQALIDAGAKVELKDNDGNTPLILAAARAHPEVIEILLKAGANIATVNRRQESALHEALDTQFLKKDWKNGREVIIFKVPQERIDKTIRMLVDAGADPTAPNKSGDTPIKLAENRVKLSDFYKPYRDLLKEAAKAPRAAAPAKPPPKPKAPKTPKVPEKKPAAPDLPTPDFTEAARSKEYEAALAELEELCGTKRQALNKVAGGYSLHVHSSKSFDLKKTHIDFLAKGFFVFTPESLNEKRVAILPTRNRDEVIAVMQTNGANYDLMPADIAAWLNELEKEQSFIVTGIGWDFLSGEFTSKIAKPMPLAKRMYEFCPDIVDQGVGDVKALAAELKRSNKLFFWWD